MIKSMLLAVALTGLAVAPAAAAAPCKDAKGKFTKCPSKEAPKGTKCRLNGKFAKCSTPGAKPI